MTNEEIKLLKNFITWQSLPFVDNLFTHEDEIIKKFNEWLRLNTISNNEITNEEIESIHGSTYGGVSWGGTYIPKEQQPYEKQIIKDWLSTFNTDSATACFTAIQELKKQI